MTRRRMAAGLGALGALLIGGVAQAFLWRWGYDGLSTVLGSQFMWILLIWAVSWAWAKGSPGSGVAAGAVMGVALIGSYYAMQWVADGRSSAISQFSSGRGVAWTLAAVGGGAVIGLFGGLAGRPARDPRWLKALGMVTPAVIVGVGPLLWLIVNGQWLDESRVTPAAVVFGLVAAALLLVAGRTCGWTALLQSLALSLVLGAAALVGLLLLQRQGWLYLTF